MTKLGDARESAYAYSIVTVLARLQYSPAIRLDVTKTVRRNHHYLMPESQLVLRENVLLITPSVHVV